MKKYLFGFLLCFVVAAAGFSQNYFSFALTPYGYSTSEMLEYNKRQSSSYFGITGDSFWGNEFGFLISYGAGFTTSFAVGSDSFSMENYYGFVGEGFAGIGYYKNLGKLYFLFGGGLGAESTSIAVDVEALGAGLPYYYSLSIGPGVLASMGYKVSEQISLCFGCRSIFGVKELEVLEKDVKNPLLITPFFGVGIFR